MDEKIKNLTNERGLIRLGMNKFDLSDNGKGWISRISIDVYCFYIGLIKLESLDLKVNKSINLGSCCWCNYWSIIYWPWLLSAFNCTHLIWGNRCKNIQLHFCQFLSHNTSLHLIGLGGGRVIKISNNNWNLIHYFF